MRYEIRCPTHGVKEGELEPDRQNIPVCCPECGLEVACMYIARPGKFIVISFGSGPGAAKRINEPGPS